MNLLLIRHGSTAWTQPPGRFQGRTDVPLAAQGYREADAMAARLRTIKLDALWSSPLRRAVSTARRIARREETLPIGVDARLIELSYGRWERRTHDEVAMTDGAALAAWKSGATAAPPGGESRAALLERVGAFVDERLDGGTIAVVAHKEVLRAFAIHLGLADVDHYAELEVPPGGMLSVTGRVGSWSAVPVAGGPSRDA